MQRRPSRAPRALHSAALVSTFAEDGAKRAKVTAPNDLTWIFSPTYGDMHCVRRSVLIETIAIKHKGLSIDQVLDLDAETAM